MATGNFSAPSWAAAAAVAAVLLGSGAVAEIEESPQQRMERVTTRLLDGIRAREADFLADKRALSAFVREVLEPVLDGDQIVRIILGKKRYAATADAARAAFLEALKEQMLRLYAEALLENRGGALRYLPYAETAGRAYQTIRSEFVRAGSDPLEILYLVRKSEARWRVFEIRVDGIFLIRNLRETLTPEIESDGLEAVIERLREGAAPAGAAAAPRAPIL